jgi:hypothetical protein
MLITALQIRNRILLLSSGANNKFSSLCIYLLLTVRRHIYISLQRKQVIHKQYYIKKGSGFILIITDPDLLLELEHMYHKFLFKVPIPDMYSHYNTKMGGVDLLDYFFYVYCAIYRMIKCGTVQKTLKNAGPPIRTNK